MSKNHAEHSCNRRSGLSHNVQDPCSDRKSGNYPHIVDAGIQNDWSSACQRCSVVDGIGYQNRGESIFLVAVHRHGRQTQHDLRWYRFAGNRLNVENNVLNVSQWTWYIRIKFIDQTDPL